MKVLYRCSLLIWLLVGSSFFACHRSPPAERASTSAPGAVADASSALPPKATAAPTVQPSSARIAEPPSAEEASDPPSTQPLRKLYIRPLGAALPSEDVEFVEQALNAFYKMQVTVLERQALPQVAYYAPRRRYRAEKLLQHLVEGLPEDGFRVLGLTGSDISTTKGEHSDWGILGLASVDGESCVISSFRTTRGARDAQHARIRLGKTAVHEIGHTLGLPHCPNRGCLMEDALGTVATTDREYTLCDECRQRLSQAGYALTDASEPPWPEPATH